MPFKYHTIKCPSMPFQIALLYDKTLKGMPFNVLSYKRAIWKGIEGHLMVWYLKGIYDLGKGISLWAVYLKRAFFYGRAFWWCFIIALPFRNYTSKNNPITFQLWPNSVTAKVVLVIRKVKVYMEYLFGS